jgi:hypothetical protein
MGDVRTFKFTAPSGGVDGANDAQAAGTSWMYLIEDTVGCVIESADAGEEAVLIYHAEKIMVPKKTGQGEGFVGNPGQRVYWDPATRTVTPNYNSGYYWIGVNTEVAAIGDEFVEIDLKGERAEVEAAL